MRSHHIHITGASGSGTSTTGRRLADRLGAAFFDTDDFFWLPTDPPYQQKRTLSDRVQLLNDELNRAKNWILSGSLDGWGDTASRDFDLVVFLYVPTAIRLQRLRARERKRFGASLDPGGAMHKQHEAFMAWSAAYDSGDHDGGRTLKRHRDWLAQLPCQVLRIEGDVEAQDVVDRIVTCLSAQPDERNDARS